MCFCAHEEWTKGMRANSRTNGELNGLTFQKKFNCVNYAVWKKIKKKKAQRSLNVH